LAGEGAILDVAGLTAGYGGSAILQGLSLRVRPGRITGVIGPNGAGKSTLLKAIVGQLTPSAGTVRFEGTDLLALAPHRRIAAGIAYVGQTRSHFPSMTVRENLRLGAWLVEDPALRARRQAQQLARFPVLAERLGQAAGLLSGGELRQLEIARMLMTEPRLVILDEPSIGLSPKLVELVYGHVLALRSEGLSFLIVEQNVKKLLSVADHVYSFESGRNRFDGTPAELASQGNLAALYLGAPA